MNYMAETALDSYKMRSRSIGVKKSRRTFKVIVAILAPSVLILFSTVKLHNKASNSHHEFVGMHNMPASNTPPYRQDIVIAHCKEDLNWLDQLHNFDPSVCSHTRIYIYSKCNAEIENNLTAMIPLTAKCSTVKRINNCGTEEYAFIQFILDHYETMSPMVSFIQGGALTENPHIIYDMMVHIPGTTFKSLSRYVKDGWHFPNLKAEMDIMRHSFPHLENKTTFITSWRGMFAASKEQIQLYPQEDYLDMKKKLCSGICAFRNCNMEIFFAPFFGCGDYFLYANIDNREQCEFGISHGIAPSVFAEDYLKDSLKGVSSTENKDTSWSRCGNKTMYHSKSMVNGMLLCMDASSSRAKRESIGGGNLTANSYNEMILNESWKPDLTNLTFQKLPQWRYIPPHLDKVQGQE